MMTPSADRLTPIIATVFVTVSIAYPIGACSNVWAAPPQFGGNAASAPLNEITSFTGKLKGMRRGVVVVEKDDGAEALVALPDTISAFQFVAEAKPAFLRRGMLVRFSGTFGPGGVPTSPINKITVFQPVDLRSVQGRAKEQFTPGVHSDARRGNRNQQVMGKATVVGSLVGLSPTPNGGILAVRAGKYPLQLPVAADAQIEIRYNNLSLAQEGDKVSVAGFYQPPNENQVKADKITVTTDRVFGEAEPKSDRRSRRNGERESGAEKPDAESDGEKGDAAEGQKDAGEAAEEAG